MDGEKELFNTLLSAMASFLSLLVSSLIACPVSEMYPIRAGWTLHSIFLSKTHLQRGMKDLGIHLPDLQICLYQMQRLLFHTPHSFSFPLLLWGQDMSLMLRE